MLAYDSCSELVFSILSQDRNNITSNSEFIPSTMNPLINYLPFSLRNPNIHFSAFRWISAWFPHSTRHSLACLSISHILFPAFSLSLARTNSYAHADFNVGQPWTSNSAQNGLRFGHSKLNWMKEEKMEWKICFRLGALLLLNWCWLSWFQHDWKTFEQCGERCFQHYLRTQNSFWMQVLEWKPIEYNLIFAHNPE